MKRKRKKFQRKGTGTGTGTGKGIMCILDFSSITYGNEKLYEEHSRLNVRKAVCCDRDLFRRTYIRQRRFNFHGNVAFHSQLTSKVEMPAGRLVWFQLINLIVG